jgi:hypothetical protein
VDYHNLVGTIPVAKRESLLNKLVDLILASKNDEKMPNQLANTILHHWQSDILISESGLAALLEAAILLEREKTVEAFTSLELTDFAALLKQEMTGT